MYFEGRGGADLTSHSKNMVAGVTFELWTNQTQIPKKYLLNIKPYDSLLKFLNCSTDDASLPTISDDVIQNKYKKSMKRMYSLIASSSKAIILTSNVG